MALNLKSLKVPSPETRALLVSCVENAVERFGSSVKFVVNYRFREEHGLELADIADRPDLFAATIDKFFGSQNMTVRACIASEIGKAIESVPADSDAAELLTKVRNEFVPEGAVAAKPESQKESSETPTVTNFEADTNRLVIREPRFFLILQESILAGMKKVLGEDGVQSTFYHLELARCIERPAKFHKSLQSMYRTGTVLLEKAILTELFQRVRIPFRERKGFGYPEYISEAFRAFLTQEMESVALVQPLITSD